VSNGWSSQDNILIVITDITGYSGLFFYSPTVGPGNLVGSWTANGGTDPYGNVYPAGLTSYAPGDESKYLNIGGSSIIGEDELYTLEGSIFFDTVLLSGANNQAQLQLISPATDPAEEISSIQLRATSTDDSSIPATIVMRQSSVPGNSIEGAAVQTDVILNQPRFMHSARYSATVSGSAGLATFAHGAAFTPAVGQFTPLTGFSQGNWSDAFGTHGFTSTQAQIVVYEPGGGLAANGTTITFYATFMV
jgi:hypothetical protein